MTKLILITNELPYVITRNNNGELIPGIKEIGFPIGLSPYNMEKNCIWFGSSGVDKEDLNKQERVAMVKLLKDLNCYPVCLTREERRKYLDGFCHRTIWPLFHYFNQNAIYDDKHWEAYVKTNRRFADTVYEHIEDGDRVWIQNYQLILLPGLIRKKTQYIHRFFPSHTIPLL